MDKKTIIIVAVTAAAVITLAAVCGYFWWSFSKKSANPLEAIFFGNGLIDNATKGTIPSLQTNPLEDKPDINPADAANPMKNIKTNPFE